MTRSVGAKLMVRCQTVMNAGTATRGTQREAGSEGQAAADERWRLMRALDGATQSCAAARRGAQFDTIVCEGVFLNTGTA